MKQNTKLYKQALLSLLCITFIGFIGCSDDDDETPLTLDLPTNVIGANEKAYPISGTCNPTNGDITLTIADTTIEETLTCKDDNTYSGALNFTELNKGNPPPETFTITITQGDDSIEAEPVDNEAPYFITKWSFTANEVFELPIANNNAAYDFTVDWGDESAEAEINSFNDPDKTHTYTEAGEYTITIKGICGSFQNSGADVGSEFSDKLLEVTSLGYMGWTNLSKAFAYNTKLTNVFGGDTSSVINMATMFKGATSATPETAGWDTTMVTDMSEMFSGATKANPNTKDWNTGAS